MGEFVHTQGGTNFMTQSTDPSQTSLIPDHPIPEKAADFSRRMTGLLDGMPKDDATVAQALRGMDEMLDLIATGLYNLASMLVGEGEEGVRLVEIAVSEAEISACQNPKAARKSSRRALCRAGIAMLAERDPQALAAPTSAPVHKCCMEDDELESAGLSREQLETMCTGSDRDRVRHWLASLPVAVRTVFVLRAVGGLTTAETAALLTKHGGPDAAAWQPEAVSEVFRLGLCSLASQLIHSTVGKS